MKIKIDDNGPDCVMGQSKLTCIKYDRKLQRIFKLKKIIIGEGTLPLILSPTNTLCYFKHPYPIVLATLTQSWSPFHECL